MNVIAFGTQGCSGAVVEYLLPNLLFYFCNRFEISIKFRICYTYKRKKLEKHWGY